MDGLIGSTYSPEDGSCSPLMVTSSYYFHALKAGVDFCFNERVMGFETSGDKISAVITDKGSYACAKVVNAAGNNAREIGAMLKLDLPVFPDNHEAGITEPVARFHRTCGKILWSHGDRYAQSPGKCKLLFLSKP